MQGKGFIKVVSVLLLLLCIYQLVFTWKANQIESNVAKEAKQYAASLSGTDEEKYEKEKLFKQEYLDSIYNEPAFLNQPFRKVKESALKLGLDLQGGMSVVLEADIKNLIENLAENSQNQSFVDALNSASKDQQSSQEPFVDLFIKNFKGSNEELVGLFQNPNNMDAIPSGSGKDQVKEYLRNEADDAFNSTYDIITSRLDKFGMSQPSIKKQQSAKRILVEIPGVDNPARVRELLQSTANLEFYEMYDNTEMFGSLMQANEVIKGLEASKSNQEVTESNDSTSEQTKDAKEENSNSEPVNTNDSKENEEEGENVEEGEEDNIDDIKDLLGDSEQTDSLEMSDAERAKNFPLFQVLQISQEAGPVVGYATKRDTSKVNTYLKMSEVKELFPLNARFGWSAKPFTTKDNDGKTLQLYTLHALRGDIDGKAQLDGGVIVGATATVDQYNKPVVSMRMNIEGATKWEDLTGKNIGKPIAIVLDNKIYSYPAPSEAISGGSSQISGNFTQLETQDLATILKTGKLDVPAKIIEEEVVGPTIGGESAKAGLLSLVAGLILVLVFMAIYYGKAGIIADIALLFNIVLVIGILAAFGSVLTLPGIAGLVLTIGMAVDANVIIFERVREHLREGLELPSAIRRGYSDSYSAILDANITTLIIALILGGFGVGPIKGFATVLIIGILTSLFTGVLFTRVIKDDFITKNKTISYWTSLSKSWFQNINFDFISKRKIAYVISGIVVLASLGNLLARKGNAFDLGVDLSAGRSYTVRFDEAQSALDVKNALDKTFPEGTSTVVRTFGKDEQLKITTNLLTQESNAEIDQQAAELLYKGLQSFLPTSATQDQFRNSFLLSSQKVDSSMADDLRKQSSVLTILALLAIFVYILIRFRKWQFGVAAVATLAHDTLVILAVFSFFRGIVPFALEVDQAFIAALLTIIGYSINDTVIVFDRIREELRLNPKDNYKTVINQALNSTFSRTIITSLTTILVVLLLFIFGGEVIRGFAFALLIGIFVGTYSSIFVATPIVVDLFNKEKKD